MTTDLAGRAEWERRQYERDHGKRAAMALGLRLAAEHIRRDENGPLPGPFTIYDPIRSGSDEERQAAVDAWAEANHVPAGWDDHYHCYGAKLSFGPVVLLVYTLPSEVRAVVPVPAEARPELAEVAA